MASKSLLVVVLDLGFDVVAVQAAESADERHRGDIRRAPHAVDTFDAVPDNDMSVELGIIRTGRELRVELTEGVYIWVL